MAFSSSGPPFQKRGRYIRGKIPLNKEEHRLNEFIRVPKVRLIDEKGNQVGIVPTSEALRMARNVGLDLMEVAPNTSPPVCKILDYGKFKYEKKKKEHAAKKKQTVIKVKEVQVRPTTDVHDLEFKFKKVRDFLEAGDKAKITMLFRGREITNVEQGRKVMRELIDQMAEIAKVEAPPKMEGRKMIMVLAPSKTKPDKDSGKKRKTEKEKQTSDAPAR